MAHVISLSFRNDVSLAVSSNDECAVLEFPWGTTTLTKVGPGTTHALQILASRGGPEDEIVGLVHEADGFLQAATMYYHLQRFEKLGILCYTLVSGGSPLVTLVPMKKRSQLISKDIEKHARFRLSRFAYLRRDNDALVLESPLSYMRTILHSRIGLVVVAELMRPRSCLDLCQSIDNLTEDLTISLLGFLADAGLIVEVSLDDRGEEDPALAQWSFHDLLFHSRSRSGTHDYPIGGTYPFLNVIPSLPALKPIMSENTVVLPKPDIRQLEDDDPPLAKVMETRKSVRRYGRQPIKTEQLSEFLYRVARVRWVADPDPARLLYYQVTDRPYPSGGACYDLELYIIANSCTGIAQGIYHYDPCDHQLCMVSQPNASMDALLSDAKRSAGLVVEPQILVVLSSRFQRLSWKYSGIAYATTLKNVGVLYQSMYLAATAMGLAPCALGAGNASLFAQAVQSEYFAESSVGEFLLGTSAQTDVGDFATMVGERWAQLWTQYQDPHDPQVCKNELVSTNDGEKRWKCCKLWQRKLSNKLNAKAFAQRHGVPVAKLLWNGPLDEVPYDHLTETYVLKLSNGSNGDQVIPVSQGYDVLHKVHVDSDSLRRRVYQMFAELNDPNSLVLLEEFIGDPLDGVPLDYKFFCFHGKVKVLYISNRNSGTLTWFDDAWEPIRETIHTSKPPGQERRPPNADQLIEAAEHLARAYEHSLVRIDLYNPGDSVFFGEFTHAPFGGDLGRFTDFANKALAELWLHPEMKYSDARRIHSG